ncbi:MAG: peptidylprolyl isomerase [bacterium]
MRSLSIFVLFGIFLLVLTSCSPEHSKIVVADLGGEKITLGEFENAYVKNTGSLEKAEQQTAAEYKDFIDLYVNFKMKLKDADSRKYAEDPAIIQELDEYKDKIGSTYVLEKYLYEPGIKQLYERKKEEIRIAHIMLRTDSLGVAVANQKADEIFAKLKQGESSEKLAKEFSEDPYSKDNGGDLYYITSGLLPLEMEDAAYNTPIGSVYPKPITTQFGIHIIKVNERQVRRHKVNARHILVKFLNSENKPDTAAALAKIKSIRDSILAGSSFQEMAKRHSDDKGSGLKGGELGFFERRNMVKQFDSTAFSLKVGELSGVVETRYGYHLIQVTAEEQLPTFENYKSDLREVYQRTRYEKEYDSFIGKLKGEYNYKVNEPLIKFVDEKNDSTEYTADYWQSNLHKIAGDSTICFINLKPISFDSLVANTITRSGFQKRKITEDMVNKALDPYAKDLLVREKAKELPKTDSKFGELMDDYRNGIYIFRLQEEEVWNKIVVDSVKLVQLYEETKSNYQWEDRVDFSEIYAKTDSLVRVYYDLVKNGENFDSVAVKYTQRPKYKAQAGRWGITDVSTTESSRKAFDLAKPGDISETFAVGNGFAFVRLNEKHPARVKTFEEAKAEVASLFQEQESKRLEEEYVQKLKAKYNPQAYYEELEKAFKKESK